MLRIGSFTFIPVAVVLDVISIHDMLCLWWLCPTYTVGKEVCVVHGICGGIHIMLSGFLVIMEWHIHSFQIQKMPCRYGGLLEIVLSN